MSDQIRVNTDAASGTESQFDDWASRITGALNTLKQAQDDYEPGIGKGGVGGKLWETYGPQKDSINTATQSAADGSAGTADGIATTVAGFTKTEELNRASIPIGDA
jgi:uncharacterized protein YukE